MTNSEADKPIPVSVVIPTRNRPHLVCRAVESALRQTLRNIEVVVVIDGPDHSTVSALRDIEDPRVRWIELPENAGGSEARNIGIREARGKWIALLDDDDEWLSTKLATQLEFVETLTDSSVIVCSRYYEQTDDAILVQPRALPRPGQHISEYLFCETSLKGIRQGFVQTSTWFIAKQLLVALPFTKGLKRNQDTDWLLRAFADLPAARLFVTEEPLARFSNQSSTTRISNTLDWAYHYQWLVENERLFTPRAAAYFIATIVTATAVQQGTGFAVFCRLLGATFRRSPSSLKAIWLCFASKFVFPFRGTLRLHPAKAAGG